jgi:hypothetical protein
VLYFKIALQDRVRWKSVQKAVPWVAVFCHLTIGALDTCGLKLGRPGCETGTGQASPPPASNKTTWHLHPTFSLSVKEALNTDGQGGVADGTRLLSSSSLDDELSISAFSQPSDGRASSHNCGELPRCRQHDPSAEARH